MTENEVRSGSPPASSTPMLKDPPAAKPEDVKPEDSAGGAEPMPSPLPLSSALSTEKSDPALPSGEVE